MTRAISLLRRPGHLLSAILGVLATAAFLAAVTPARAAGHEGWLVTEVKITGLPQGISGDVVKGLGLRSSTGFGRTGKVRFRQELLELDLQRLRLLLARSGYPYAQVEPGFTPDSGVYQVKVKFVVQPGPTVQVGAVRLVGLPDELLGLEQKARDRLPTGSRVVDARVRAVADHVLLELQRGGYALARVRTTVAKPDSFTADIAFQLNPGEIYQIAEVRLSEIPADLDRLARRSMNVRVRDRFSPDLMNAARQNLRDLQLFRQIKVRADSLAPGQLALSTELKPAAMRTARVSIGSWSDDPVRLRAQWRHRNIFGRGRGFEGRGSYSPHQQELGAGVWWPALMAPRSVNELWARYHREVEDAFELETMTLETAAILRPASRVSLRLAAAIEDVMVDVLSDDPDVYTGESGTQLVLSGRWFRDGSDHLLYPTRGTCVPAEEADG
jgi:outer membrane translocation and assembly module TamA